VRQLIDEVRRLQEIVSDLQTQVDHKSRRLQVLEDQLEQQKDYDDVKNELQ
jgi:hypothetical protein